MKKLKTLATSITIAAVLTLAGSGVSQARPAMHTNPSIINVVLISVPLPPPN